MRNFSGVACACDISGDDIYGNGDNDVDGDNDGDNDGDMTTASVAKVVPVAISPPQRG